MYLRSALGFVAASVLSASLATTSYAQPSKPMPTAQGPSKSMPARPRRPPASRRRATAPRRPRASRCRLRRPAGPRQVDAELRRPAGPGQVDAELRRPAGPRASRMPRLRRPAGPGQVGPAGLSGAAAEYRWITAPRSSVRPGILVVLAYRHRRRAPASRFHRGSSHSYPLPLSRVSRLHPSSRRRRIESSMPPPASRPIEVPALSRRRMPLASRSHFR